MSSAGFISTCILAIYVAIVWDKNANNNLQDIGSYCPFAVKKSRSRVVQLVDGITGM